MTEATNTLPANRYSGTITYHHPSKDAKLILQVSDKSLDPSTGAITNAPQNFELRPGTWNNVPCAFIHYLKDNIKFFPAVGRLMQTNELTFDCPLDKEEAEKEWGNAALASNMSTDPSIFQQRMGLQKVDPQEEEKDTAAMKAELAQLRDIVMKLQTQTPEPAPSKPPATIAKKKKKKKLPL